MGLGWLLVAVAIFLWGWGSLWRRVYAVETSEGELHFASTSDGWRIALSRYRPAGEPRSTPVVLCHGLGANRSTFEMAQEVSLARVLAAEGFDVWALELRGHGHSSKPAWFRGRGSRWNLDDYLTKDIPAAVALVLERTGAPRLDWIGHSMGGVLLYAYLSRMEGEGIRKAITVGSSLDYSGSSSQFGPMLPLLSVLQVLPSLPYDRLTRLLAPFAGRLDNPLERFLYWPPNISGEVGRRLLSNNCHPLPTSLLKQLSTAFLPGGLRWNGQDIPYLEGLSKSDIPVLALAGDRDLQCPIEAAQATIQVLERGRLKCFGLEHGHGCHYGHFDLLMGKAAAEEVFPEILRWLRD